MAQHLLRSLAGRLSSTTATRAYATTSIRSLAVPPFSYKPMFDLPNKPETKYRKIPNSENWVSEIKGPDGSKFLSVQPKALEELSYHAMRDIAHLLRPAHLQQLRNILDDKEASDNDRFVALELLKNANIAAGMILPGCQDTGTAIVMGKRGMHCLTDGDDEKHMSQGIYNTYTQTNLRYSVRNYYYSNLIISDIMISFCTYNLHIISLFFNIVYFSVIYHNNFFYIFFIFSAS